MIPENTASRAGTRGFLRGKDGTTETTESTESTEPTGLFGSCSRSQMSPADAVEDPRASRSAAAAHGMMSHPISANSASDFSSGGGGDQGPAAHITVQTTTSDQKLMRGRIVLKRRPER